MFYFKNVKFKNILDINDLEIPAGKVTAIVGESGSGKTTLLKLLNKLISPDEGEITYHGTSLENMDSIDLRREVVMMGQEPVIFPGTVEDNLLMGLKFSEKPLPDKDTLQYAMRLVLLDKPLSENAGTLSGGEKQRLCFARVVLICPEVFLLDEPTSALDEGTEEVVMERFVDYIRKQGQTLIMVTHSLQIAEKFSDIIVEIKQGKVHGIRRK